jgi:hypothetical protein
MAMRFLALNAVCPLPLVLISVRGCVDPRVIGRLEVLGKLKNQITLSGIEPAALRLVA